MDVYQRFFNVEDKAPIISFCGGAWFLLLAAIEMNVPFLCLDPNKNRRGTLLKHNNAFTNWIGKCCSAESIDEFIYSMDGWISMCQSDLEEFRTQQDQVNETDKVTDPQHSEEEDQEEQMENEEGGDNEEDKFDSSQLIEESSSGEDIPPAQAIQQPQKISPPTKLVITQNSKKIVSVPLPIAKPAGKRPHASTTVTPPANVKRPKK
jgi:hypothetical protein